MIGKKYILSSLLLCVVCGVIFSISSLAFKEWTWLKFCGMFLFGVTIGGLLIPEIEPKAIKRPVLFQTIVGAIGGAIMPTITIGYSKYTIIGIVIGATLGFFAQFWVRHMPTP